MWEIIDNNGTIHSGSKGEMEYAFEVMTNPEQFKKSIVREFLPDNGWNGDLKLIQVHKVSR